MFGISMDDTPYNARYAKPRSLVRNGQIDCPQLLCSNGCKRATRRHLFKSGLFMAKQMEQESGRNILLRRKCRETTPNAHFSVCDINNANRGADTNQNIARFRQFCWRFRLDWRMLQEQISEINLSLMEFCSFIFIQGLADRRLPHVYA